MAAPKTKAKPKPATVTCGSCRHFRRDTTGPSFAAATRVYFMGTCAKGLDPDRTFNPQRGTAKVFADHPRICSSHINAITQ